MSHLGSKRLLFGWKYFTLFRSFQSDCQVIHRADDANYEGLYEKMLVERNFKMIKWGIIGAGNIANRFADSLKEVEGAELYAVACRTMEKSERFRAEHPCEVAYDSYSDLLADPQVEAVYIALPHKYHLEWVTQAIEHGKAVLCEKPATLSGDEMQAIADLAREKKVFFMEAMKSRFVPAYRELKAKIEAGVIGEILSVSTSLCHIFDEATSSYHFEPVQGGPLLDMGIYNVSLLEDFMPAPIELEAIEYETHPNGIELYVKASLRADGVTGVLETGFDRETETLAVIEGSKGSIRIPSFHRAISYELFELGAPTSQKIDVPYEVDDFYSEIAHVVSCLEAGQIESPIMPLATSQKLAEIVDLLKAAIV